MRTILLLPLLSACGGEPGLCRFGNLGHAPDDQATSVPTNGRLVDVLQLARNWDEPDPDDGSVDLVDDGGIIVPLDGDMQANQDQRLLTRTPSAPLKPNTRYRVLGGGQPLRSFTTGDGPDHDPPAAPVILGAERHRTGVRGSRSDQVELVVEGTGEDTFIEVTVIDVSSGDTDQAWGFVPADRDERPVWVGEGVCTTSVRLRGAVDLVVRAFDVAGNVSEPTEPMRF